MNLIPFNEVTGLPYRRPTPEALADFLGPLKKAGISVKVRKRKGAQIDAACGQLRRSALEVLDSQHRAGKMTKDEARMTKE